MFNLSRYFSALSLILIIIAGLALGHFYRQMSMDQLMRLAEDRNVAMTQVFRNSLWPRFAALPAGGDRQARAEQFRREVAAVMEGTDAIKVKVYDLQGLTLFSTDLAQIGEDKGANPGFVASRGGRVVSELTHRNSFDTLEGSRSDLDVISSYVPIRNDQGDIEGVFELYQDVTHFVTYLGYTQWWIATGLLGVFAFLYLAQFIVVSRAHGILLEQESALGQANLELEARVQERTRALEDANRRLQGEIDERRAVEERLDYLAYHDPLTGLPNRLLFYEQLEHGLKRAERGERKFAVMFIDLDHFKDVNDTLGHQVGDKLLKAVAARLTARMRACDMLSRLGGDEFLCLIEDIHTPADAATFAAKLIECMAEPYLIDEHELQLSSSIGLSLYPADGDSVDLLVRNADTAMYQAKSHGRNAYHFYTPEMTTSALERLRLERLLHRAIDSGEITLQYQPQVDSVTGRLLGAEALVRWNSAELGPIASTQFIPVAEESGYITYLGEWVLRQACRQLVAWNREGFDLPQVSVNLSLRQLDQAHFVDLVRSILQETGVQPAQVELEITESVIMAVDHTFAILEELRQLGIKLSVDDFGTGYSSLSYLKLLPIQKLKIDQCFVMGIGQNQGDEAIIHAIVALARSLHLEVIAEGVETAAQNDFLAQAGCRHVQGYLYSRPLDPAALLEGWRNCRAQREQGDYRGARPGRKKTGIPNSSLVLVSDR